MKEHETIAGLFRHSIYRIPDYQRGYSWQEEQLRDFWIDLINLDNDRKHYTGVLTLKEVQESAIPKDSNVRWLIDNGHRYYLIIDGQQRLTTCVILLQCIFEKIEELHQINFRGRNLHDHFKDYLFEKSADEILRSYKFGYEKNEPLDNYFRYFVLNEPDKPELEESLYTMNMYNAKIYFKEQLKHLLLKQQPKESNTLERIFKSLTTRLLFNVYEVSSEFDEFVAFETMNNRGKRLSILELLKNRLIFLTTLYGKEIAYEAKKKELRDSINGAWKEIYKHMGKNKSQLLNDDDFLKAHWIMYFQYTRNRGDDYVKYLLGNFFSQSRILRELSTKTDQWETIDELSEAEEDFRESEEREDPEESTKLENKLEPQEILKYTKSIQASSGAWYKTWFPNSVSDMDSELAEWIEKLNRLPIFYCRPLVMSLLLKEHDKEKIIETIKLIERYLFIAFRLNKTYSNSGSSQFYNASRELYHGKLKLEELQSLIKTQLSFYFTKDDKFKSENFKSMIKERFEGKQKNGFYGWPGIEYFLYEYELCLMKQRGTPKIGEWKLFTKSEKDKTSIEHILPQNQEDPYWKERFTRFTEDEKLRLCHSLGNLLPLSLSINIALQNGSFDEKKNIKMDSNGKVLRQGYKNGSYSEIEVSEISEWTHKEIRERGLKLLKFLEKRWNVSLGTENDKLHILNLDFLKNHL